MSDYVEIPEQIKYKMKTIEFTVDIMFLNNIPFEISLGKDMKFTTIEKCGESESGYPIKSPP